MSEDVEEQGDSETAASQSIRHDLETEQQQQQYISLYTREREREREGERERMDMSITDLINSNGS